MKVEEKGGGSHLDIGELVGKKGTEEQNGYDEDSWETKEKRRRSLSTFCFLQKKGKIAKNNQIVVSSVRSGHRVGYKKKQL